MTNKIHGDYYERLGISGNSTSETIRQAFFEAVRKFPPEKSSEEYKLIREAYDVLKNPKSRDDYDSRLRFGPEIERHNRDLDLAFEFKDWGRAEDLVRRLIRLQPKNALNYNRLGIIHNRMNNYQKAVDFFLKAYELEPEMSVFLSNAANAYCELEQYYSAEKYYKRAWVIDSSNYDAARELATMYFLKMERKIDAVNLLKSVAKRKETPRTWKLIFLTDLARLLLLSKDKSGLRGAMESISDIVVSEDDKKFVTYLLYQIVSFAIPYSFFDESAIVYDYLADINDDYSLKTNATVLRETFSLYNNNNYTELIRNLVVLLTMHYFNIDDNNDLKDKINDTLNICQRLLETYPDKYNLQSSLANMRISYSSVYNINCDLFSSLRSVPIISYLNDCPYCKKPVTVCYKIYNYYSCPHCNNGVSYSQSGYDKVYQSVVSNSSSSSCFIATATMQNETHPTVVDLRHFREYWLVKKKWGKILVSLYDKYGPILALLIQRSNTLRMISYYILVKPLHIITKLLHSQNNNE